jgi:hypothetical protein
MNLRFLTHEEQAAIMASIELAQTLFALGDKLGVSPPSAEGVKAMLAVQAQLKRGKLLLLSRDEDLKTLEAALTECGQAERRN